MNRRKFVFVLVSIFLLTGLITACVAPDQPTEINSDILKPEPISTDTPVPEDPQPEPEEPVEEPEEEPAEEPEDDPVEPPPPAPIERSLDDSGPWVLHNGTFGLSISNQNATGMSMLHEYAMATPFVLHARIWPAPKGGRVAVLELIHFDRFQLKFPYLKIIKIPSGEVEFEHWLIPQDWIDEGLVDVTHNMQGTRGYETQNGMRVEQIFAATGEWNEMAWSHDGSMLAFNAAIDGESADLYLYDTRDGSLSRLTDGPSQSVDPVFSPDDQYIVHGAVETLNWGKAGDSGYDYQHYWAARSDGGGVTKIYNRDVFSMEHVLGWRSDTEFLITSYTGMCGNFDLRVADIEDGLRYTLIPDYHRGSAYAEGQGKVLFYVDSFIGGEMCPASAAQGVYLFDLETRTQKPIAAIEVDYIQGLIWNEETGLFYVSTSETFYTVDLDGNADRFKTPNLGVYSGPPLVSPDGQSWIFFSEKKNKIAMGTLDGYYEEFDAEEPGTPLWVEGGAGAIFQAKYSGEDALFGVYFPIPEPLLIHPEVWPADIYLVYP